MKIEWDNEKEIANQKKHGIRFNEAESVFFDQNALFMHDPDHSIDEDRYLLLGLSLKLNILVVVHCYRNDDELIRILSARKASKKEQQKYRRRKNA